MVNRQTAEAIQLRLEYNPAPPFNAGSPDTAPAEVLALLNERVAPFQQRRREAVARAAAPAWMISPPAEKKAAWFPRRPFLFHGSSTLTGDFRTSAPGAYLPAVSYSGAAANRDSRELKPEPTRWFPTSARSPIEPRLRSEGKHAAADIPAVTVVHRPGMRNPNSRASHRGASVARRPRLIIAGRLAGGGRSPASSRRAGRRAASPSGSGYAAFPIRAPCSSPRSAQHRRCDAASHAMTAAPASLPHSHYKPPSAALKPSAGSIRPPLVRK